jgi:O-antigen/teichoic acid export membrane protein
MSTLKMVALAPRAYLRRNFIWTLAGNGVYGASQWAVLSLIAKLGSTEMLGRYALAVAIATPPMMLSHLNLRAVLATDAEREHPFADYLKVRHAMNAAGMVAVACIAFASVAPMVTLLIGVSLAAENQSDLYFGALQRRERMDTIASSMMLRGAGSVAAVAGALAFTNDLIVVAAALCSARLLLLFTYDRPKAGSQEAAAEHGQGSHWRILRNALPLGAVLMLISLTTNLPRYAIERLLGTAPLGIFAAIASFVAVGYLVTNALGQSTMPRLARCYVERDLTAFRKLTVTTALMGAGVGVAGVIAATLIGAPVLALLYRPEFADFAPVLIATMAAGILLYTANTLGYANTSTRKFDMQVPLFGVSALVCFIASEIFIPRHGLMGAAMALASAAAVQIVGHLYILRRTLREAARQ